MRWWGAVTDVSWLYRPRHGTFCELMLALGAVSLAFAAVVWHSGLTRSPTFRDLMLVPSWIIAAPLVFIAGLHIAGIMGERRAMLRFTACLFSSALWFFILAKSLSEGTPALASALPMFVIAFRSMVMVRAGY